MVNKVRVYGKAQNRTVLGIINAYLVMYPQATLSDLRKAFPNQLNPGILSQFGEILRPVGEARAMNNQVSGSASISYFDESEDLIHLSDGTDVALINMWPKKAFDDIVTHAGLYGIEVAEFEKASTGTKGGFRLEYLNGYVPPAVQPVKEKVKPVKVKVGMPWWKWLVLILLIIVLIVLIILLLRGRKVVEVEKVVTVEVETEKVVTVVDTVYVNRLAEFEADFNATQFLFNSAELSEESKEVLRDLARYLKQNEDIKLHIVGHTSSEGNAQYNQKLSEDRAKSAMDYLIERGISADRLSSEGKGSSEPIDPDNLEVNRRTEFRVVE